ncbi:MULTISPECIES: hypothetical protein [unclassified Brevibacterium]|uniref:hypothetical protein n=1 Tax=unclassified Brevibacterium TaxID=2614124 RepID=UPI0010925E45|nr:hypothetical protein [Brevibacterium sp. S22]
MFLSLVALVAAAGFLGDPDDLPPVTFWSVASAIAVLFVIGVFALATYVDMQRKRDEDYLVVRVGQIGFGVWVVATGIAALAGWGAFQTGVSSASVLVAAFSVAFLLIGVSMAGAPKRNSELRFLQLLKRVANWQLLAGSAVIAVIYVQPAQGESFFERNGENFGLAIVELFLWVVGAGLMTVLLEPLKFKRESAQDSGEITDAERGQTAS